MEEQEVVEHPPRIRWVWRLARVFTVVALLTVLTVVGASLAVSKSRPATGLEGPTTEAMVRELKQAVDLKAWEATKVVRFTFSGRNQHLWDRHRGLSRVEWGDVVVLQRLDKRVGRAWRGGREIHGKARERLVKKAWESHINDTFWLQPFSNLDDRGVRRSIVEFDGMRGLLVEYGAGGVTPGDAYWWEFDPEASPLSRPVAWRMWVKIIPLGGVRATWDGWVRLPTGAWIATSHDLGPARIKITDLTGGASLESLGYEDDPFEPLIHWN